MSGTASDGAEGIRAIKARCGITFAQDEESAQFRGMPQTARATGAVDYIRTPAEIATELVRIGQHRYLVGSGDPQTAEVLPEGQVEIQKIYQLVERVTHVDFALYKQTTVRRRIGRRMIVHRCDTVADYLALLQQNLEEVQELYKDILIYVTSFFRDPVAFQALTPHLERMVSEAVEGEPIRVWVAGCATGEEAAPSPFAYVNSWKSAASAHPCSSSKLTLAKRLWCVRAPEYIRTASFRRSLPSACVNSFIR